MPNTPFPWEHLKAECLRLVCAQLIEASEVGSKRRTPSRRDEMVAFLRDIEENGFESAVHTFSEQADEKKDSQTQTTPSSSKRKNETGMARRYTDLDETEDDDGEATADEKGPEQTHNTRYKGSKRVKVAHERGEAVATPRTKSRSPRKSRTSSTHRISRTTSRARKAKDDDDEYVGDSPRKTKRGPPRKDAQATKRPRGRPRKDAASASQQHQRTPSSAQKPRPPQSRGRAVFAGIVLTRRNTNVVVHPMLGDEADAEGEVDPDSVESVEGLLDDVVGDNSNKENHLDRQTKPSSDGGSNLADQESDPTTAAARTATYATLD